MIRKLLIANRGEIACRIMRTARRMGITTVAVYSDADASALHVRSADEAVRIGTAPAAESYLDAGAIIEAALKTGADAVHPGYGFLSENAGFAEAVAAAGLILVGPPVDAIRAMGDKARAKAIAIEAGVPVVPGYSGDDQSNARFAAEAEAIGFPLLVKAAAGGGGRGMRIVESATGLVAAMESARREAENAFGDGTLLLEKLVAEARHIEIQVFADAHGACIHLGERDCSTQRRHQKVIEEAPSPFVDANLRAAMGADAVKLAKAVGYAGAGTVEFIVGADRSYHFLEMNTRLQVEHPVTEMVTGLDLVEWQLRVASGEALPLRQDQIAFAGHAIEARLYAEDPYAGFAPQTGNILHWRPEAAAVRIDTGIAEGEIVTPFYDPMISKLIAHGESREEARATLVDALRQAALLGVVSNRSFLIGLLESAEFREGRMNTDLLERWSDDSHAILISPAPAVEDWASAAAILARAAEGDWFRSTGGAKHPVTLECAGVSEDVLLRFERGKLTGAEIDGGTIPFGLERLDDFTWHRTIDSGWQDVLAVADGRSLWLDADGKTFVFTEPDFLADKKRGDDPLRIISPVSGLVRAVLVAAGQTVQPGDAVAVIEAMKMETTLSARVAGTVRAVHVLPGQQARTGDVIAEIEADHQHG